MSWDVRQLILGVHIFLGIMWFGSILFVGWGVFPATQKLKPNQQREFLSNLLVWIHWPLTFIGLSVIATGIILGTFGGPLKSWESVFSTSYGMLFMIALIVGVVTLLWGVFISYKHNMNVFSRTAIWDDAEKGDTKALKKAFAGIAAVESVEIAGFLTILTCMVLI